MARLMSPLSGSAADPFLERWVNMFAKRETAANATGLIVGKAFRPSHPQVTRRAIVTSSAHTSPCREGAHRSQCRNARPHNR
jgi:hypothetical protein